MIKYIIKRVLLLTITLLLIITVVFFLLELMQGYPSAIQAKIESAKTPQQTAAIIAAYQQDSNVFVRYGKYISGIFDGNFGTYFQEPSKTIIDKFTKPIKWTLLITGPAFIIGTFLGLICGFIAGYKRGKWPDILVNFLAMIFISIPSFVLATFFILLASKTDFPFDLKQAIEQGETFKGSILPILVISITSFSGLTYFIRNEVVEVLASDYISIARAKGLSEKSIFFKHVLKNVSIPIIAIVLPAFVSIIVGSLIIEIFFNVPGSAHIFAGAVRNKEKFIILFSVIFFSGISMLLRIITDVLFVVLDPRIKIAEHSGFQPIKYMKAFIKRKNEKNKPLKIKKEVN